MDKFIISVLLLRQDEAKLVFPYIKEDYFESDVSRLIFSVFTKLYTSYQNAIPSKVAMELEINTAVGVRDNLVNEAKDLLQLVYAEGISPDTSSDWIMDSVEKWCKSRSLFNAIMESISIIDGDSKKYTKDALPSLFQNALNVSFDTNIGHDYFTSAEARYDYIHSPEEKIEFDLDELNIVTNKGISRKTLNVFMGSTGVGKTLTKCHFASKWVEKGYNVLYFTFEMSEFAIAERIDANILGTTRHQVEGMEKAGYLDMIGKIQAKTRGTLIVKEFPTGAAHVGHLRAVVQELKQKMSFVPDIIIVDYLNIMASQRIKRAGASSYEYVKAIAEELRGFGVETNAAIVTSTQTNRSGVKNTEVELGETSESFGTPMTADLFVAIVQDDQMQADNLYLFKVLKNRYSSYGAGYKFFVGVDKSHFRLLNSAESTEKTPQSPQNTPIADKHSDERFKGFSFGD
jgi:replicative DNA helicase